MKPLEQDILSRVKVFKEFRFFEADTGNRNFIRVEAFQRIDITDITQEEMGILLTAIKQGRVNL